MKYTQRNNTPYRSRDLLPLCHELLTFAAHVDLSKEKERAIRPNKSHLYRLGSVGGMHFTSTNKTFFIQSATCSCARIVLSSIRFSVFLRIDTMYVHWRKKQGGWGGGVGGGYIAPPPCLWI